MESFAILSITSKVNMTKKIINTSKALSPIEETHQVMQNLKAILSEAELDFNAVVKTTIFLSDMELFGQVNDIYGKYFEGDFPARETVAVKGLPKNVNVEISMIAISDK